MPNDRLSKTKAAVRPKPVAVVAALLFAGFLAWPVVVNGVSENILRNQPDDADRALQVDPTYASAATVLAGSDLDLGHVNAAIAAARHAVRDVPISSAAVRVLSYALLPHDPAAAARVMGQASALGWRDPLTQLWISSAAFEAKDYVAAAAHADALARSTQDGTQANLLVDRLLATPEARPAMLARMALNPDWRLQYFDQPSDTVSPPQAWVRALALRKLFDSSEPPSFDEVRPVIVQLIADNLPEAAHILWHIVRGVPLATVVADANFTHAMDPNLLRTNFDWAVAPLPGVTTAVETAGNGTALHITTDGNASGIIAQEMISLPPGKHRLTVQAHYGSFSAADAIRWRVRCSTHGEGGMFVAPAPTQASWNVPVAIDFNVADDGTCSPQWLQITAETISPAVSADSWFTAAKVE